MVKKNKVPNISSSDIKDFRNSVINECTKNLMQVNDFRHHLKDYLLFQSTQFKKDLIVQLFDDKDFTYNLIKIIEEKNQPNAPKELITVLGKFNNIVEIIQQNQPIKTGTVVNFDQSIPRAMNAYLLKEKIVKK